MENIFQHKKEGKMKISESEVKEVAIQLANVLISNAANEDLDGEAKETKVIEFIVKLDDMLPIANFIPNALEAQMLDIGLDIIQEYFKKHDIKDFIKKCYNRIKHLFKKN